MLRSYRLCRSSDAQAVFFSHVAIPLMLVSTKSQDRASLLARGSGSALTQPGNQQVADWIEIRIADSDRALSYRFSVENFAQRRDLQDHRAHQDDTASTKRPAAWCAVPRSDHCCRGVPGASELYRFRAGDDPSQCASEAPMDPSARVARTRGAGETVELQVKSRRSVWYSNRLSPAG